MKRGRAILFIILAAVFGVFAGWEAKSLFTTQNLAPQAINLREGGYKLINPLLVCNAAEKLGFYELKSLEGKLNVLINKEIADGRITAGSVYFRDLETSRWASINEGQKFYPSSLGKVPIMMAYFRLSESQPELLNKVIIYKGGDDLNAQQEIKPLNPITPGKSYSVIDLLNSSIKYSDNNADALLFNNIDQGMLKEIYSDLNVPTGSNDENTIDFITPKTYVMFWRTLYNSTYLNRDSSEKALQILSDTDFKKGLVTGVPDGVTVAHKFGLISFKNSGVINSRELHDCGIIYAENPYILCVMTKNSTTITDAERALADISRLVYEDVKKGNNK